jgi:hypothetical protein
MCQRSTTHAERVEIVERHLQGQSLPAVAKAMGINCYTARKWWRVYRREGWSGLLPKPLGPPVTGLLGHFDSLVKYVALRLKLEHPKWGPTTTLFYMRRRSSLRGLRLPQETVLWEYWHQFRERLIQPRRPATKRPDPAPETEVVEVHQRWQIDFKGEVETSFGWVSPFQVRDVVGRATLGSFVHLLGIKRKESSVSVRQVQEDLRQTFTRWGLPDEIQMDRDPVFVGSTRLEWPGTLLLWLVGLGIVARINPPRRPDKNGTVERAHRTWNEHVLVGSDFADLTELQQETDHAWADRNWYLPSRAKGCDGKPPLVAHSELLTPRRSYSRKEESSLFNLRRVDQYLAQWEWRRHVDSTGQISLANHNQRVGRCYQGQMVKIRFDPTTRDFVCRTVEGKKIHCFTLVEVSAEYILGFTPPSENRGTT